MSSFRQKRAALIFMVSVACIVGGEFLGQKRALSAQAAGLVRGGACKNGCANIYHWRTKVGANFKYWGIYDDEMREMLTAYLMWAPDAYQQKMPAYYALGTLYEWNFGTPKCYMPPYVEECGSVGHNPQECFEVAANVCL